MKIRTHRSTWISVRWHVEVVFLGCKLRFTTAQENVKRAQGFHDCGENPGFNFSFHLFAIQQEEFFCTRINGKHESSKRHDPMMHALGVSKVNFASREKIISLGNVIFIFEL